MYRDLSPFKCFGEAWQFLLYRPGLAYGATILYLLIMTVGGFIPFFSLIAGPPMIAGFVLLSLNLAGRREANLEDLFQGFREFGRSLGAYFLLTLGCLAACLPTVIGVFYLVFSVARDTEPNLPAVFGVVGLTLLNLLVVYFFSLRWIFVLHVVMDEPDLDVMDCFRRSYYITRGNQWNLVGMTVIMFVALMGLYMFLGMMFVIADPFLLVGTFVFLAAFWPAAMAFAMIAVSRAYLWLKGFHPRPVPAMPPAPTQPLPTSAPIPQ
ncbi:MAG: hypothetical protein KKA42_00360 [candidate division Zixibacteria bacterium]|nr:hypothetical protein [candidate division Zixibacteria bacterium]